MTKIKKQEDRGDDVTARLPIPKEGPNQTGTIVAVIEEKDHLFNGYGGADDETRDANIIWIGIHSDLTEINGYVRLFPLRVSGHPKSSVFKLYSRLIGEPGDEFDTQDLVGCGVDVDVTHNPSKTGDSVYANIKTADVRKVHPKLQEDVKLVSHFADFHLEAPVGDDTATEITEGGPDDEVPF